MEKQLHEDRWVPWPWSLVNAPVSVKDLVGRPCRVVRPGDAVTQELLPGRITIYLDDQSKISDICFEPERPEL
jgi:hypothetical protein